MQYLSKHLLFMNQRDTCAQTNTNMVSFQMHYNMIALAIFMLYFNQTEFRLVVKSKEKWLVRSDNNEFKINQKYISLTVQKTSEVIICHHFDNILSNTIQQNIQYHTTKHLFCCMVFYFYI